MGRFQKICATGISASLCYQCDKLSRVVYHCEPWDDSWLFFGVKLVDESLAGSMKQSILQCGCVSILHKGSWVHKHFLVHKQTEQERELVLHFGSDLLLLLYNSLHGLEFLNAYQWDGSCWKHLSIRMVQGPDTKNKRERSVVAASCQDGAILFSCNGENGAIDLFTLELHGECVEIKYYYTFRRCPSRNYRLLRAAADAETVKALIATCYPNTRWARDEITEFFIEERGVKHSMLEKPFPPWDYNGPYFDALYNKMWFMIGYKATSASERATLDKSVWYLDLDKGIYRNLNLEFPPALSLNEATFGADNSGNLIVADLHTGVYQVNLIVCAAKNKL
ncbi:unnamed protein product [Soboliphyme baturini]|uniref:RAB3GAP2_N domain-containing protein n=1 Tax=Soboliphyme baturini TaxID=241478 RepID=A0A183J1M5_9BILA|nr:unnamed protein product [Soboliphyme baturini]